MNKKQKIKIISYALVATILLLSFYFIIVTIVSGFNFALSQFKSYWYFLTSLAVGFGIQIGLYSYLKQLIKNNNIIMGNKAIVVTGTTSTLAMISCCAHYLINIVPVLGISGTFMFITSYQVEIFWIGLLFNIFGIIFISNKIIQFKKTKS